MTEEDVIHEMDRVYNISGVKVVEVRVTPLERRAIEDSIQRGMRFRGVIDDLVIHGAKVLSDSRVPPNTVVCLTSPSAAVPEPAAPVLCDACRETAYGTEAEIVAELRRTNESLGAAVELQMERVAALRGQLGQWRAYALDLRKQISEAHQQCAPGTIVDALLRYAVNCPAPGQSPRDETKKKLEQG